MKQLNIRRQLYWKAQKTVLKCFLGQSMMQIKVKWTVFKTSADETNFDTIELS